MTLYTLLYSTYMKNNVSLSNMSRIKTIGTKKNRLSYRATIENHEIVNKR